MSEWKYVISTGFALRVPPIFSGELLSDHQLRLSDTASQTTMEIRLLPENPGGESGPDRGPNDAGCTCKDLKLALARMLRRNWSVKPVGDCRDILGTHHPTVSWAATETAGLAPNWVNNILGRRHRMHWRFWAVGCGESWLLAACHGPAESMLELRNILDRVITSVRLLPATAQINGSFIQAVAQQARMKFPAKVVDVVDDQTLSLDGIRINVIPLLQDFLGNPRSLESATGIFLDDLLLKRTDERDTTGEWQIVRNKIVPFLMPEDQIATLTPDTFNEEWTNGLLVCYQIQELGNLVTHTDRRRWGIAPSTLRKQAMINLHRHTRSIELITGSCDDCCVVSFSGQDNLNSSRILLPSVHARLHRHLGDNFLVAMPDRDTLLAFQIDRVDRVEKFRRQVSAWYAETSDPLCERLFLVTPHGVAAEDSPSMNSWREKHAQTPHQ